MKRAVVTLLVASLVLAGVFGIMRMRERIQARTGQVFSDTRMDEIVRLTIRAAGDSVTLLNGASGWILSGDAFPADGPRLSRVFGHLAGLQTRETVIDSADEDALSEYGFRSGQEKHVEWEHAGGRVHRVVLGKISGLDFGSVFWKPADGPQVYRTPGKFVWEFSSRPMDWKDTNLYHPQSPFRSADVRALDVEWLDVRFTDSAGEPRLDTVAWRLERRGERAYVLVKPDPFPVPEETGARLFRHAEQFKIDGFLPGPDPSARRAGLDTPYMTIRFELEDGSERRVVAGARADRLFRYARHASHPDPVRVFAWRFDYFRVRGEEIVGK